MTPKQAGLTILLLGAVAGAVVYRERVDARERGHARVSAACVMNAHMVQQAVRSYENMNGLKPGDPLPMNEIFGEGKFLSRKPTCPPGGTYRFPESIPGAGKLACTCSDPDHAVAPDVHKDW